MTSLTSTQLVYIWTLIGFLLAWMIVFALLALLPGTRSRRSVEREDHISSSTHITPSTAPSMLRVLATPPIVHQPVHTEATSYESPMMAD